MNAAARDAGRPESLAHRDSNRAPHVRSSSFDLLDSVKRSSEYERSSSMNLNIVLLFVSMQKTVNTVTQTPRKLFRVTMERLDSSGTFQPPCTSFSPTAMRMEALIRSWQALALALAGIALGHVISQ